MNVGKRLYPTVREEREKKILKKKLRLTDTAISKGGGMPTTKSSEKARAKERRIRD